MAEIIHPLDTLSYTMGKLDALTELKNWIENELDDMERCGYWAEEKAFGCTIKKKIADTLKQL